MRENSITTHLQVKILSATFVDYVKCVGSLNPTRTSCIFFHILFAYIPLFGKDKTCPCLSIKIMNWLLSYIIQRRWCFFKFMWCFKASKNQPWKSQRVEKLKKMIHVRSKWDSMSLYNRSYTCIDTGKFSQCFSKNHQF